MKYPHIREEELKNKVAEDYFWMYDCTQIIGDVDFCVRFHHSHKSIFEMPSLLWAEAKKGSSDIFKSIVQLILTIGKARTFDQFLPPTFLGAFDSEKIAFIPYSEIHEVFYMNDFNWNVAPSNHHTKEFKFLLDKVQNIIQSKTLLFNYLKDNFELQKFIKYNFVIDHSSLIQTKIDKNNFMIIYNKWLQEVKPTIAVNWNIAKKMGIIDGDFYLADLISQDNFTLRDKLFVLLRKDHYELDRKIDEAGMFSSRRSDFTDKMVAHTQFWNRYERPPKEEYWDYIVERRDLLVPQDIRERKGSFFTPQIWVELSQKYLAEIFGEDWQDEYYIWDCAAGTGNLLNGLTNKYHIWASTIDLQDVEVMHERIEMGANLSHEHVFQFDFLNDEFKPKSKGGKIPDNLFFILSHPKERRKLIIYINPPYAEATTARTVTGTGENKSGVATSHKANQHFKPLIGNAANELFALFMAQIYANIPDCLLAQFSTLKFIQGTNFRKFKEFFLAKFMGGFVIPSFTFDNVKSNFPIGFTVWDTSIKKKIQEISCDVYDKNAKCIGEKKFYGNLPESLNKWIVEFKTDENSLSLGFLVSSPSDFQHQNQLAILSKPQKRYCWDIKESNLIMICIYFAVRHCIKATWLNNRDQFLYPNDGWKEDKEFQYDCLVFTLFHAQNRISCKDGTNHWIPFTEKEINAKAKFNSHFMSNFIKGKKNPPFGTGFSPFVLFEPEPMYHSKPLKFSPEAQAVMDAGLELWKYYHAQPKINVNASLYDIKEYFQGRNEQGKLRNDSSDETYMHLMNNLKEKLFQLAFKLERKVYQYEFLK